MTVLYLDACCLLLTLLPVLPSVTAAVAYEQAASSQPYAGFHTDGEVMPESWKPAPSERERDAA